MNALERCFVVFVFLFSATGLLIPLLRQQSGSAVDAAEGDPLTQAIWLGIYAATLFLVAARWKRCVYIATGDKLLLTLVGIALVSVLWSAAPEVTLRRGVALAGTTLFGVYLAARYTLNEQLRLLAWALGTAALLSLLFGLALPSYGISGDLPTQGDWVGIFNHKNALGGTMALGAVVFLILAASHRRLRWLTCLGFAVSIVLILLANSQTALVTLAILLVLYPVYRALRWPYTLALPVVIVATLLGGGAAMWFAGNAEVVLGALGRDATLTGRTDLWAAVSGMIRERPWLGYGYSGFWLGPEEGGSARVWIIMGGEEHPHAHNGFLDLWLDLGLLGTAAFSAGFLLAAGRAVRVARSATRAERIWPLVFLTFVMISSATEAVILKQNSILWIVYVATVLSLFVREKHAYENHRTTALRARRHEWKEPVGDMRVPQGSGRARYGDWLSER